MTRVVLIKCDGKGMDMNAEFVGFNMFGEIILVFKIKFN